MEIAQKSLSGNKSFRQYLIFVNNAFPINDSGIPMQTLMIYEAHTTAHTHTYYIMPISFQFNK